MHFCLIFARIRLQVTQKYPKMTIEKRGKHYRVKIFLGREDGKATFESKTFLRKSDAAAWKLERQARMDGKVRVKYTFGDALKKYLAEVSPEHKGYRWEKVRIDKLATLDLAKKPIQKVTDLDIADWRDSRLKSVSGSTVRREMKLISSILEVARKEWKWIRDNPSKDVKKPKQPKGRRRRISQDEIDLIVSTAGYKGKPDSMTSIAVAAFLFAIETGMRSGEILGLEWGDIVGLKAILQDTKNGDSREVPLSKKARDILASMKGMDKPFSISPATRDTLFRRVVTDAGIGNLRFHDSRAEAIYRLSKKTDVLELSRIIGHQDINSLRHYYNTTADEIAERL